MVQVLVKYQGDNLWKQDDFAVNLGVAVACDREQAKGWKSLYFETSKIL